MIAGSRRPDFPTTVETLLFRVAVNQAVVALQEAQVRAALERADDAEQGKNRLQAESIYLRSERDSEQHRDEMVGRSPALKRVLQLVEQVAPTTAGALIQGETGTGKELVARAIHRLSGRRDRVFVKINCAAIPTGLIESELFGHERGAFTGAMVRKIGRFELAHQGTLFLDEVGEIPVHLQAKLLRVLQEREFERLGSNKTIQVDIRLIAASNRDLGKMVADGEFRSDLFYRLNVFPIVMPPLRDRAEDIPLLAECFTDRYARQIGRPIREIPAETMNALTRHSWPGNVREMENLIERSVILSRGSTLQIPPGALDPTHGSSPAPGIHRPATLEKAEREHILRALESSNWVIAGMSGAAARLGVKRTSLQYKMKKLGINRPGP